MIKTEHKKVDNIKLLELNHQFITGYEFFLKTVRNVEHNTAMGIIMKLKKIVRSCVARDWLEKDLKSRITFKYCRMPVCAY